MVPKSLVPFAPSSTAVAYARSLIPKTDGVADPIGLSEPSPILSLVPGGLDCRTSFVMRAALNGDAAFCFVFACFAVRWPTSFRRVGSLSGSERFGAGDGLDVSDPVGGGGHGLEDESSGRRPWVSGDLGWEGVYFGGRLENKREDAAVSGFGVGQDSLARA